MAEDIVAKVLGDIWTKVRDENEKSLDGAVRVGDDQVRERACGRACREVVGYRVSCVECRGPVLWLQEAEVSTLLSGASILVSQTPLYCAHKGPRSLKHCFGRNPRS